MATGGRSPQSRFSSVKDDDDATQKDRQARRPNLVACLHSFAGFLCLLAVMSYSSSASGMFIQISSLVEPGDMPPGKLITATKPQICVSSPDSDLDSSSRSNR